MMREMKNVPGIVRAVDRGNGICELVREPDVLIIKPVRRRKYHKLLSALGTMGIFLGAAAAVICLAPALGTLLFGLIAGCMFFSMVSKEED